MKTAGVYELLGQPSYMYMFNEFYNRMSLIYHSYIAVTELRINLQLLHYQ